MAKVQSYKDKYSSRKQIQIERFKIMYFRYLSLCMFAVIIFTNPASAKEFKLTSKSITEGLALTSEHVFKGFGCEGKNLSPQLSWENAPAGTKSFAVTVYDPDAPTGSGWWHWNIVNIPASVTFLPKGAIAKKDLPKEAVQIKNDYGSNNFGGACPPPGEVHRYIFTVYALSIEKLSLPENTSNALAGFMTRANAIASAKITAIYKR